MESTGRSLVEHWSWAASKGLMNRNTANSLRAACSQVLSILDDWESVDVRTLDVEDLLRRFENLRAKEFHPQSLDAYKRRFKSAVRSYLSYVEDPGGWKPTMRERPGRLKETARKGSSSTSNSMSSVTERAGMVDYPFPLRKGQIARLVLPADLTQADIRRLTAFMQTLAVDSAEADDEVGD